MRSAARSLRHFLLESSHQSKEGKRNAATQTLLCAEVSSSISNKGDRNNTAVRGQSMPEAKLE